MLIALDMDGTLFNPEEGIANAINHSLQKLGMAPRKPEALGKYIGPTVYWIYKDLLGEKNADLIEQGREAFSTYYREIGYLENFLYPNIVELLDTLKQNNHSLIIVTAKTTDGAVKITDHFDITHFFDGIYGRVGDREKYETLQLALDQTNVRPAVMVGDRRYDMEAAKRCGCTALGANWGFGSKEELLQSGADHLLDAPMDLATFVTANYVIANG